MKTAFYFVFNSIRFLESLNGIGIQNAGAHESKRHHDLIHFIEIREKIAH